MIGKKLDLLRFSEENKIIQEQIAELDEQLDDLQASESLPDVAASLREYTSNISPFVPIMEEQIRKNENEFNKLVSEYPQERVTITEILKRSQDTWKQCLSKFTNKEKVLQSAYDSLLFETLYQELNEWLLQLGDKLHEELNIQNVTECERAFDVHQELNVSSFNILLTLLFYLVLLLIISIALNYCHFMIRFVTKADFVFKCV